MVAVSTSVVVAILVKLWDSALRVPFLYHTDGISQIFESKARARDWRSLSAVRGRAGDWQRQVVLLPAAQMLDAVGAVEFERLWVDRLGCPA